MLRIAVGLSWSARQLQGWKLLGEAALYFYLTRDLGHVGIGGVVRGQRRRLSVDAKGTEAAGHIVLLLFIHFLPQHDLARYLETLPGSLLVDFGRPPCGVEASVGVAIGPTRSGNECPLDILEVSLGLP